MAAQFRHNHPDAIIGRAKHGLTASSVSTSSTTLSRDAWITRIPGAVEVTVEVLESSALPDELRDAGYELESAGHGERIIPRPSFS
jgi:hypothetical protein